MGGDLKKGGNWFKGPLSLATNDPLVQSCSVYWWIDVAEVGCRIEVWVPVDTSDQLPQGRDHSTHGNESVHRKALMYSPTFTLARASTLPIAISISPPPPCKQWPRTNARIPLENHQSKPSLTNPYQPNLQHRGWWRYRPTLTLLPYCSSPSSTLHLSSLSSPASENESWTD